MRQGRSAARRSRRCRPSQCRRSGRRRLRRWRRWWALTAAGPLGQVRAECGEVAWAAGRRSSARECPVTLPERAAACGWGRGCWLRRVAERRRGGCGRDVGGGWGRRRGLRNGRRQRIAGAGGKAFGEALRQIVGRGGGRRQAGWRGGRRGHARRAWHGRHAGTASTAAAWRLDIPEAGLIGGMIAGAADWAWLGERGRRDRLTIGLRKLVVRHWPHARTRRSSGSIPLDCFTSGRSGLRTLAVSSRGLRRWLGW